MQKKREEFNCYLSPSHLSSHDQDSWLLPRLSTNNKGQAATAVAVAETDNDSGLDSPQEDHTDIDKATSVNDDNQSEEMQEVRLNMRARHCRNITAARPRIPIRLCKVTKV